MLRVSGIKIILIIICCFIAYMQIDGGDVLAFYYGDAGSPGPNDVHIGKTIIEMPLEKILLVRRHSEYCAIKFTRFWTGKTEEDYFAIYESHCQSDKSGDFSKKIYTLKEKSSHFLNLAVLDGLHLVMAIKRLNVALLDSFGLVKALYIFSGKTKRMAITVLNLRLQSGLIFQRLMFLIHG